MKDRRVFFCVLTVLIFLFIASCGIDGGDNKKNDTVIEKTVEKIVPPNRGVNNKSIVHINALSTEKLYNGYSIIARIKIGNYLGEKIDEANQGTGYSFFEANTIEVYRGELPDSFKFCQHGNSLWTFSYTTLVSYGNEVLVFLKYSEKEQGYVSYTHGVFDIVNVDDTSYVITTYPNSLMFRDDAYAINGVDNVFSDVLVSAVEEEIAKNDEYWRETSYPQIEGIYRLQDLIEKLLEIDKNFNKE